MYIKSNKTYDSLRWVAQIFLPALASAYFALDQIWGLPKVNEVVGTITVLDTFLGLLLKKSSDEYLKSDERFDGSVTVEKKTDTPIVSANIEGTATEIAKKDEVVLKVDEPAAVVETELVPKKKAAPRKRNPKPKKVVD